jgi:Terminase large subunit, T4likevirus-type, N-terminal/Terminase RNaseH-like domain
MSDLKFELLKWQREVLSDNTRFKVVVAGRRCGKSRLAAVNLFIEGLQCPKGSGVMYIAPTQGQARVIIWQLLLDLGREVIASSHVNNAEITLVNGAVIYVRGADRPDTLRGVSLTYVVLDEYADMKPIVWEQVVRACLTDKRGRGLFIGTPKGRNHFYDLYKRGESEDAEDAEYKSWLFFTSDNELIRPEEIASAKRSMSSFSFNQEYMASFNNAGTNIFKEEWLKYGVQPKSYSCYIAIDLAGFEDVAESAGKAKKRLDRTAIAVVFLTDEGVWFVRKIEAGRWNIRETAVRILKNIREFKPTMVGMEKGALFNAVMPYLTDLMRKNSIYCHVSPLTHGNQKKEDRVIWALQGMFEHGRIVLNSDCDWDEFRDEYMMFPTSNVHDDQIDALSMIAQMAVTVYSDDNQTEEYEPIDVIVGF